MDGNNVWNIQTLSHLSSVSNLSHKDNIRIIRNSFLKLKKIGSNRINKLPHKMKENY